MNLVPATEQNFFLFVDSVAGTKYGGFRYREFYNLIESEKKLFRRFFQILDEIKKIKVQYLYSVFRIKVLFRLREFTLYSLDNFTNELFSKSSYN
jgi:hypothetical protein